MFLLRVFWLTDLTKWLWDAIVRIFGALITLLNDLVIIFFDGCFSLILLLLGVLPLPDFLAGHTMADLLGSAGSTIVWFCDVFQISNSMRVISAAMVFQIMRRLITLGIW